MDVLYAVKRRAEATGPVLPRLRTRLCSCACDYIGTDLHRVSLDNHLFGIYTRRNYNTLTILAVENGPLLSHIPFS